jgi:hypothetical protein
MVNHAHFAGEGEERRKNPQGSVCRGGAVSQASVPSGNSCSLYVFRAQAAEFWFKMRTPLMPIFVLGGFTELRKSIRLESLPQFAREQCCSFGSDALCGIAAAQLLAKKSFGGCACAVGCECAVLANCDAPRETAPSAFGSVFQNVSFHARGKNT